MFNSGGSYLGIHDQTDSAGDVSFELPAGDYKFRADYNGTQYWSEIETITSDQTTNVNIDIQTASHSCQWECNNVLKMGMKSVPPG